MTTILQWNFAWGARLKVTCWSFHVNFILTIGFIGLDYCDREIKNDHNAYTEKHTDLRTGVINNFLGLVLLFNSGVIFRCFMLILGVLRAFWCWSFWGKNWVSAHFCTVFPYQWKDSPPHRQIQPDCQRQILKLFASRFSELMILLEMALIKIILSPTTIDVVAVTKMRRAKPRSFIFSALICNCFQPAQEGWLEWPKT